MVALPPGDVVAEEGALLFRGGVWRDRLVDEERFDRADVASAPQREEAGERLRALDEKVVQENEPRGQELLIHVDPE